METYTPEQQAFLDARGTLTDEQIYAQEAERRAKTEAQLKAQAVLDETLSIYLKSTDPAIRDLALALSAVATITPQIEPSPDAKEAIDTAIVEVRTEGEKR